VIMINLLLISTESKMFQQMGQTISQCDFDSTETHFLGETEMFLFLSESGTVPQILMNMDLAPLYVIRGRTVLI
jgi:hypothetical protein